MDSCSIVVVLNAYYGNINLYLLKSETN